MRPAKLEGRVEVGGAVVVPGLEVYKCHFMEFGLSLAFFLVVWLTGVCVLPKMYENPSD